MMLRHSSSAGPCCKCVVPKVGTSKSSRRTDHPSHIGGVGHEIERAGRRHGRHCLARGHRCHGYRPAQEAEVITVVDPVGNRCSQPCPLVRDRTLEVSIPHRRARRTPGDTARLTIKTDRGTRVPPTCRCCSKGAVVVVDLAIVTDVFGRSIEPWHGSLLCAAAGRPGRDDEKIRIEKQVNVDADGQITLPGSDSGVSNEKEVQKFNSNGFSAPQIMGEMACARKQQKGPW